MAAPAWHLARSSADPHRAERLNLSFDSAMGGVWIALMRFNLLPSVLIVAMLSMDKIGWGARFLARTTLVMIAAGAAAFLLAGAPARFATTMAEIVGSLPLLVAYPLAIAVAVNQSGRLARDRRKAMEQVLELREQLAHAARVGTLGEMAAGLAHELNQPLTAIHLEANVGLELAALDDRAGVADSLVRISEQSLRAGDIVRRMRTFARRGETTREPVDLADAVGEVLALLDHDLRLAGVETTVALGERVPMVVADRVEIQQVLVNLIRNAIEAMSRPAAAGRRLTIRTGRARRGGTGLGRGHRRRRGSGRRRSAVPPVPEHQDDGARPRAVDLPVARRGARRPRGRRTAPAGRRALLFRVTIGRRNEPVMNPNPPVFVIDDEEPVRVSLGKLLRALGVPSQTFPSAEAFLASYAGDGAGCLLVDIRMPGMSGLDLIEELRAARGAAAGNRDDGPHGPEVAATGWRACGPSAFSRSRSRSAS